MIIENNTILHSVGKRNGQTNAKNISFNANPLRALKPIDKSKAMIEDIYYISGLLNENINVVKKSFDGVSKNRTDFLHNLARKYNHTNFYKDAVNEDEKTFLWEIYNNIKKPCKYHFLLSDSSRLSFENLSRIFEAAKDKKTLEAVYNFHKKIVPERKNGTNMILEILNSDIGKDFVKHPAKYSSYLKLNFENPDAVKNLKKMVANNEYSQQFFDRELDLNKLYQKTYLNENPNITLEKLRENYSESGKSFICSFFEDYYSLRSAEILPKDSTENLLKMYKTATSKNIDLRISLLNSYKYSPKTDAEGNDLIRSEIEEMTKLFDRIDNDKYAAGFIRKAIKSKLTMDSFKDLNLIIDKYGSKKLYIYFNNVNRILKSAVRTEYDTALEKGIDNPFFETSRMRSSRKQSEKYLFREKLSYFDKWKLIIQHKVNNIRFKYLPETEYNFLDLAHEANVLPKAAIKTENLPAVVMKPLDFGEFAKPVVTQEKEMKLIDIVDRKVAAKYRKLKVISDVNEVLKKNMRKTMFDKNKAEYEKKATKIRLSVLPDIFNSIKETRRIAKSKGEKHNLPTKKDALTLYRLTTGRNKKLVKYMLNKTNDKGERIFTIKDIINLVQSSEEKIKEIKSVNKEFKAKDARLYYNNIFDGMVEEYGKLPPRKKAAKASNKQPLFADTL